MKKMVLYITWLFVLMFANSCGGATNISTLTVTQHPKLGMAFPGTNTGYYQYVADAGVSLARQNVVWGDREVTTDNNYQWGALDTRVGNLNINGIECVMTFVTDNDAAWAAPWREGYGTAVNQVPVDLNVWADFVTDCVERYDFDGVDDTPSASMKNRYYSIVNEWPGSNHGGGGWAGSMEELIDFTNATYAGIIAADTDCKLILGGWSSTVFNELTAFDLYLDNGTQYTIYESDNDGNIEKIDIPSLLTDELEASVRSYYRVLNESSYDYFDLHLYGPVSDNEYRFVFIKDLLPNKSFVSLEQGGPNQAYDSQITQIDMFNTAIEINLDNIANDIVFSLWFGLGSAEPYSPSSGLTWGNAYVPWFNTSVEPLTVATAARGSYWAYWILAEILENMTDVSKISDGVFKITRSDGGVYIGWGSGTMTLPGDFTPVQRLNILTATPGTFEVGSIPAIGATITLGELPIIVSEMILGN